MHRHAHGHHSARHARPSTRTGHLARLLVAGVAVAAGTAVAAGPASAHEHDAAASSTAQAQVQDLQAWAAEEAEEPADAFGQMLADARQRAAEAVEAEQFRERAERRERKEQLAKKHARALAAKVRASRAALRSTVVRPIAGGYRLTARFDDGGSLWGGGRHTGLDFACGTGTPVHVVADGVVISAGYDGAYGNRIEVRHADGTVTTYNHLSAIEAHGGRVHAGEVIGRVGSTGNTTGAHLHFEVQRGGEYVDPEHWLAARYVTY